VTSNNQVSGPEVPAQARTFRRTRRGSWKRTTGWTRPVRVRCYAERALYISLIFG